jgi:lysozyme family protein
MLEIQLRVGERGVRDGFDRRDLIKWSASASAGLLLGSPASAQKLDLLDLLGLRGGNGPKLPGKPINILKMLASIVEMESKANASGLPASPLAWTSKPTQAVTTDGSIYQEAVPRLVALIDRSETTDPALADQAGELLAQVHATEREVPEALKSPEADTPAQQAQQARDRALSRAHDFASLREEYAQLFSTAQLRPEAMDMLDWNSRMILQSRTRYESVGKALQVPWYFIGAIHGLESSFNFRAHLHNGDFPLTARTRQVPAGRPLVWLPPSDWESSAKDALRLLKFAGQTDWSLERTLYRLEAYNGFGYRKRGVPSPYLWCFSNHYERGKFVSDGRWNPSARSRQCGAATVLKSLSDKGEIKFA